MSGVPHVASADSLREHQYSLTRFWNPSTDNWEGANFTLLSGLSAFSCSLPPPQLIEWSHPESFPLVTPLGQTDVLAVPQHLPTSSMNSRFIESERLTTCVFGFFKWTFLLWSMLSLLCKLTDKFANLEIGSKKSNFLILVSLEILILDPVAQSSPSFGPERLRCCWNASSEREKKTAFYCCMLRSQLKSLSEVMEIICHFCQLKEQRAERALLSTMIHKKLQNLHAS